jgi:hypothetical protein
MGSENIRSIKNGASAPRKSLATSTAFLLARWSKLLHTQTFRIAKVGPLTVTDLDHPMAGGDLLTIYSNEIARHGVQGRYVAARPCGVPLRLATEKIVNFRTST